MLSVLLIALLIVDWAAVVILVRAARQTHEASLKERASGALILTIGASCGAVLALNYLDVIDVPRDAIGLLFVLPFILLSVPQMVWLAMYWRGKFA